MIHSSIFMNESFSIFSRLSCIVTDYSTMGVSDVVIGIDGMTCTSCVRNIEDTISQRRGVIQIQVSLKDNLGRVRYDPDKILPDEIVLAIDDMGFEASLKEHGVQKHSDISNICSAIIAVEGMTCHSCVRHIEGTISGVTGVKSIQVSLEKKQAVVVFDPSLTTAVSITNQIDDMGFDASLSHEDIVERRISSFSGERNISYAVVKFKISPLLDSTSGQLMEESIKKIYGVKSTLFDLEAQTMTVEYDSVTNDTALIQRDIESRGYSPTILECHQQPSTIHVPQKASCFISIKGMTCQSCVRNIESSVSATEGIFSIKVSLEKESAVVEYFLGQIDPAVIAERIDDMGFEAAVMEEDRAATSLERTSNNTF